MKHHIPEIIKAGTLALLLSAMPAALSAQEKAVVMLAKDGRTYELPLNDVDRIDFGQTEVTMTGKTGGSGSMEYAQIDRIIISSDYTGIAGLTAQGDIAVYPSVTSGPLNIAGAPADTRIAVYTLGGTLVKEARTSETMLTLDLSDAPSGMMIVQVGTRPVKIIKK